MLFRSTLTAEQPRQGDGADEFHWVAGAAGVGTQHMHDLIPHATLAVIDAAGHLPNLERPTAFNDALQTFLSTINC